MKIEKAKLSNYVPVNRKLFEHSLWCEERPFSKFEAWLDLIRRARFEDGEAKALIGGKLIKWDRGELPVSLRYLADKWGWSKNKVDDFIKMLEIDQMITKRTQEGTSQSILKLCNYDSYNSSLKFKGQAGGQQGDSEGTGKGQQGDKYNKDINNGINNGEDVGDIAPVYHNDDKKRFSEFQKWISQKAPNVSKLKEPFTLDEYLKLRKKFTRDRVQELILKMHNWKPLLKNNISAYRTILNWAEKDYKTEPDFKNNVNERLKSATNGPN